MRCRIYCLRRCIAARRLSIRTRRRRRAATYLRICHEAAQRALEEHRGHWGRSQDQRRQNQPHAALLHRLAGHAVAGGTGQQILVHQCRGSEGGHYTFHHVKRDGDHRCKYGHREHRADALNSLRWNNCLVCSNSRHGVDSGKTHQRTSMPTRTGAVSSPREITANCNERQSSIAARPHISGMT